MKMIKFFLLLVFTTALGVSQLQAGAVDICFVDDFTAGGSSADDCYVGDTANDSLADINALWDGGWTEAAKYENDDGLESGSMFDLSVSSTGDGLFDWSIPYESLADFTDAVFVVKQANFNSDNPGGWIAYLFEPLLDSMGNFLTANSFDVDDYSHVSLYVRGEAQDVPEFDGAQSTIAFALLAGIIGLIRERKK